MSEQSTPETTSEDVITEHSVPFLGNIAFWCRDFDAMRRFYSETLGVPELAAGAAPRNWVFYGNMSMSFSLNQAELVPPEDGWARCPRDPSLGQSWRPYVTIYVPNLDAVIARCRAEGAPLHTDEPFSLGRGFGNSIEVMDPDGNTVAITQR